MDRLSAEKSIAVFGFAGVIIGAVLPWARIIPFSVPGTDGNGVITLALGGVGLSFIMLGYTSTTAAAAAVLASIALGIGIYEISNISSVFPLLEDPSLYPPDLGRYPVTVGSGLCLTVFGGLMAAFGGILEAIRVRPQALDQAE